MNRFKNNTYALILFCLFSSTVIAITLQGTDLANIRGSGLSNIKSTPASGGTPSATGGDITTNSGYLVHTFTNDGTFTVSGGSLSCEVLIVLVAKVYACPAAFNPMNELVVHGVEVAKA